jgi:hypothetical protein
MQSRPSQWVISVQFADGPERYYGDNDFGGQWTPHRGNARRYESKDDALFHAYGLKEGYDRIVEVGVEELVNPRRRY